MRRLIEEIYRTGSETRDWTRLVSEVTKYAGVRSGSVGISDYSTGYASPEHHVHGLDEDIFLNVWLDDYGYENPWTEGEAPLRTGQLVTGMDALSLDDLRALPLYSDVLLPIEIEDTMVVALSTTGSRVLYLALYQDREQGPFRQAQRELLQPLVPHLVRAAAIETMLLEADILRDVSRAALDEVHLAIFTISELRAEPLNRRAVELLQSGDGLVSRSGCLRATDDGSNESLQNGLIAAGGGLTVPSASIATPFPLRRGVGRLPLTCWAVPISSSSETSLARLARPNSALLFVGDPGRHPELASETIGRLFGLTPAEAQVATSIASGETPREYAERLGLSVNTVRWTVKQVQAKLGLRRQLDIASAVLRATPNGRW